MIPELQKVISREPVVILLLVLVFPVTALWFGLTRFRAGFNRRMAAILLILYALFLVIFLYWCIFSVYLQVLPVLLLAAALYFGLRRPLIQQPVMDPKQVNVRRQWIGLGLVVFALMDLSVLSGLLPAANSLELEFPLGEGWYSVTQGGNSVWLNYHIPYQAELRYAMDIVQLDAWGRRAKGILPESLPDYFIYGDPVLSPCDGVILAVQDGVPASSLFGANAFKPNGNYVIIACDGAAVTLEHLLAGSIPLQAGQVVGRGEWIGRVGNSGTSSEPHLHIHAQVYQNGKLGGGMAITFQGRTLVRNSIFRVKVQKIFSSMFFSVQLTNLH